MEIVIVLALAAAVAFVVVRSRRGDKPSQGSSVSSGGGRSRVTNKQR